MEIAVFLLSVVTGVGALSISLVNYLGNRANQKAVLRAQQAQADRDRDQEEKRQQLEELGLAMTGFKDLTAAQAVEIKSLREQLALANRKE